MSEHPPLRQLHEYACGSLDEKRRNELARHIDGCFECTEEVEASKILDSIARAGLRAFDRDFPASSCLSPGMLAGYFDGSLSADRLAAAERHLSKCRSCRGKLVDIHAIMERRQKGELAELDKETGERVLDFLLHAELATLACTRCGRPNQAGIRFCTSCGAALAPTREQPHFPFARRRGVSAFLRTHVWLVLSLGAMVASLLFNRYFIQCAAVALILGAKWVLDRTQFSFYGKTLKSLRSDAEPEEESKDHRRKAL